MPLYEYECQECGHRTEVIQRLDDPPLAVCPSCGGKVERLLSAPAFKFKGSGWYVTDYAKKGSGAPASAAASEGASEPAAKAKSESAGGESSKAPAKAAD